MMATLHQLTPTMASRKLQVLGFIKQYIAEHDVGPSLGEISAGCDIDRSTAQRARDRLARDGLIVCVPGRQRGISLPGDAADALRRLRELGWKIVTGPMELTGPGVTNPILPLPAELDHVPDVEIGTGGDDRDTKPRG